MSESNYKPNGSLQGDPRGLPNRGSSTGMNGDTYGANLDPNATNRQGGMGGKTQSDPVDMRPGCNNKEGC